MAEWFIPPLRLIFPRVQWYGPKPCVYLTFDDGPHPRATPEVIDVLREEGVKATFFLLGENVRRHPQIVKSLLDEGHTIGNHTNGHRRLWFKGRSVVQEEIGRGQDAIGSVAGKRPLLFRPPYGLFDPWTVRYAADLGLRTVLFSVNSWDFSDMSEERILDRVVRSTREGDIIVFHDSDKTEGRIGSYLRKSIGRLREEGFSFAPLL